VNKLRFSLVLLIEWNASIIWLSFSTAKERKLTGPTKVLQIRKKLVEFYADPANQMNAKLTSQGFQVSNHVTGKTHIVGPKVFAAFCIVMIADFMEQGVSGSGIYSDENVVMFSFVRLRFWADIIRFISPFLDVIPPIFEKFGMLEGKNFLEPTREEVLLLQPLLPKGNQREYKVTLSVKQKQVVEEMIEKYPYLPEARMILAGTMKAGEPGREKLVNEALELYNDWGNLMFKQIGHVRDAVGVLNELKGVKRD